MDDRDGLSVTNVDGPLPPEPGPMATPAGVVTDADLAAVDTVCVDCGGPIPSPFNYCPQGRAGSVCRAAAGVVVDEAPDGIPADVQRRYTEPAGEADDRSLPLSSIMPSVGRVLHLYRRDPSVPFPGPVTGPEVALVTRVWGQDMVNVRAHPDSTGDSPAYTSVRLYDPLSDEQRAAVPEYTWAEWMPYQKGQAQKTEDLAGAIRKELGDFAGTVGQDIRTLETRCADLFKYFASVDERLAILSSELSKQRTAENPPTTLPTCREALGRDPLDNIFAHHPPKGEDQVRRYAANRKAVKTCAEILLSNCRQDAPEIPQFLAALRNAMFWSNAAIACNE